MVESTFQLARGIGPVRERQLWQSGITRWDEFPPSPEVAVSTKADRTLRAAIAEATDALACRDADRLAALLPSGEHWRLFDAFGDDAAYLDIETSDDVVGHAGISAIGILDRHGPQLFLAGRDLARFPEATRDWSMLVTFNGLSFDVPILRRAFPEWEPPGCHVDLRHVLARLGHSGGLKAIERSLSTLNLARPAHLSGLGGWDAGWLYRRGRDGDRQALRRFAEYNLYDAVNLRTLMAYAYNALVESKSAESPALRAPCVAVPGRGDVLYDVSKILLAL
ncbi:MAG: hypothetical protein JWN44_5856 [Myxococcales bacterium]|nr:hypothetical protein [Myxococcales bacterium]